MTTDAADSAAFPGRASSDSGLRCPVCEYNLTGLAQPRCPECGATFEWDEVRRAEARRPTIAFERASSWRKLPALVLTWATVLFTPWIFARQIVVRVSVGHAVVFAVICFGIVMTRLVDDWSDRPTYFAWLATGVVYIGLQAALLTLLDPHGWRTPWAALRFWLLAGCYTSAVVPTEVLSGPPLIGISDLDDMARDLLELDWIGDVEAWFVVGQMTLWLLGLACIYVARLRRRHFPRPLAALLLLFVIPALMMLYAFCVETLGAGVFWSAFGGSIGFP
jgi:hypothetical protein